MNNIILFDSEDTRENLLPLTFTRPICEIRVGILTIKEKWELIFSDYEFSFITAAYLQHKYQVKTCNDSIYIAGNILPDEDLVDAVNQLESGEALTNEDNRLLAFRGTFEGFKSSIYNKVKTFKQPIVSINMLYDIFMLNGDALLHDFKTITKGRKSQAISASNTIIGDIDKDGISQIFIEPGAVVEGAFLNVKNGPIYIGRDAEIMEGSAIRAPFAACRNAKVNMCAKIYGATTIGPYCKVGGELNNVVMIAYSNKAHDGFLGNAVIGEWCNIGGGTTASNLKNDYTEIKLWNYPAGRFLKTGLQFCGLIMGDHSKAGINCMFNTATVIGVGVNIHGAGFPRNFVPSFSEGSTAGFTDVSLSKFFAIAERVMSRRGKIVSEIDREIFESIYNIADNYK
ncbi:MAG: putative sugar nucleotidyl transferase [Muribaculaceae bacterium]|nr:putative sugar nucleotidyl transferase [Muribaculaceae bacterium]